MKTSCPFVGFAAANLFWVLGWLSIIWQKHKVNSDSVVEASYTRRHVSYKKLVDLVFESLKLGFGKQSFFDVISDGVGTGAILQLSGGILHRAGAEALANTRQMSFWVYWLLSTMRSRCSIKVLMVSSRTSGQVSSTVS